ncbi:protein gone early isoform X2 [Hermetia illucens]|uniref:protein gone early isoform X2 n=1 Tax=Hermetia illucens TaxID=343691 RepID=UPI0018CBF1C0|nr:protein gone early isoform X2 [Hermetia illucens]
MGGGKQKGASDNSEVNDDSKNGFREPRRGSRNRADRNVEEARPLRRSFESRSNPQARNSINGAEGGGQSDSEPKGSCGAFMSLLEMPKRAQLPFLIAIILCVIFLVILICLIAFWPRIPHYMTADVCTDKECMDASQQMLIWTNLSADPCQDAYKWACGKFDEEYSKHSFYGYNKGEWNFKAYQEYKEILELDQFISQLPSSALSYSAPSILKGLYKSCRDLETLDKAQAEFLLKKAMHSLGGWRAFRESKREQMWAYTTALIHLQASYGSSPFFKVSVENRVSHPYGKIITIDEGEVGLPHKMFYSLDNNHKIVKAYKMLLRDFAINMGLVVEDAKLFANGVFHYEQRIVSEIQLRQETSDNEQNQIRTLGEVKKIAPSLPIFESVQAIFSKTKITEKTEVLVRNVDTLETMSIIVSTSDRQPLNDFIIWSVARKYLPYMSREYRALIEDFEKVLHGHISTPPKWYFCSKTIQDWVPFAIDVLKQNPALITTNSPVNIDQPKSDYLLESESEKNEELLKLMFFHIRNELQESIENADWIKQDGRHFLSDMLSNIKLQIGIPTSILDTNKYVNEYYEDLLLQNLFFVEHLEPFWLFAKKQMERKLKPSPNLIDVIVDELYPGYGYETKLFTFNAVQNMAIISKRALQQPYFHYKYPISVNFARVGADIAELLLRMVFLHSAQYNDKQKLSNHSVNSISILGDSIECLNRDIEDKSIPNAVITKLYRRISSINLASKSMQSFVRKVDNSEPISGSSGLEDINYHDLELDRKDRQAGMRKFENEQIFVLSQLQRYCSVTSESYSRYKPYIEGDIAESESFQIMWSHLEFMTESLSCSSGAQKCSDIL